MKKNKKCSQCTCCQENETKKDTSIDTEQRIYNFLNTAEKIAVKLAQIHQILKKSKKKKNKKLGKVDKKTGTLILKGQKKQKVEKPMKRYKASSKK